MDRNDTQPEPTPPPEDSPGHTMETAIVSEDERALRNSGAPDLGAGTTIGRYVVQDVLGRGGMGIVYRAHDPDLGRDVAIKLLRIRSGSTGSGSTSQRVRILREAQALAKLSHPNIVGVHDVGTHGQTVFLAMEFVPGRTLSRWILEENPSYERTLKMLIEAGRGLCAAHAAGLVHRDVKPDNIFIGNDGRARIGDFGLARSVDAKSSEQPIDESARLSLPPPQSGEWAQGSANSGIGFLDVSVTMVGSVLGTPQYMAAEQFRGEQADAKSDQFSFCVTLYEALYGLRPFIGATYEQQAARVQSGERPVAPKSTRVGVPRRVHKILLRGLAAQASARFDTLAALLDELERDPLRKARNWLMASSLVAASGAVAAAWLMRGEVSPCGGADHAFAEAWGTPQRTVLRQTFMATGRPYAADTFGRVATALDDYGEHWKSTRRSACEATRVHQEQSEQVMDLRMACLDDGLTRVKALTTVWSGGSFDAAALDRAVEGVQTLPSLARCSDATMLMSGAAPPRDPAVKKLMDSVRRELATVYALEAAARYEEAVKLVRSLVADAERTHVTSLQAEVQRVFGVLLREAGDARAAETPLVQSLTYAARARDFSQEADSALDLLYDVGYTQARRKDAMAFLPFAQAIVAQANETRFDAQLASMTGLILWAQGDYAEAKQSIERAVSLSEEHQLGAAQRAHALNNLGLVTNDSGDPGAALAVYDRALAAMEKVFGPAHPNVAMVLNNRGNAYNDLKNYPAARADFERSLSVWEGALGSQHGDLSIPLTNIGAILNRLGEYEQARPLLERALLLDERTLGQDHADLAFSLTSLADTYYGLGRFVDARKLLERALAIRRTHDVPAVRLAETLFFLGKTVAAQGERALSQRYIAEMTRTLGDDHVAAAEDLRERYAAWLRTL